LTTEQLNECSILTESLDFGFLDGTSPAKTLFGLADDGHDLRGVFARFCFVDVLELDINV
jgi:hypothetical protein